MNNQKCSRIALLASSVLFLCLIGVRTVSAQADPCEDDRAKYCPMYRADDPRRLYCLKSLEAQIKPGCKASLRGVQGTDIDFIDECADDYHKVCADVAPGKGRILKCLKSHSKELGFECRKKVSAFPDPK